MILKLKLIRKTDLACWYEDAKGNRQWVPLSVCHVMVAWDKNHEVRIEEWWLKQNPFERPAAPQEELKL